MLITVRPRAGAAAGMVCAVAVAVAGCAGSPSAAGSSVPSPAVPRLAAIASRAAKAGRDSAPSSITAVLTTHAKALTSATPGDFVPGGSSRVFLITMRGHFTLEDVSRPPGAAAPTGSYLSLVVDARTFEVLDTGLSRNPPPVQPASLGPVTRLAHHTH